MVRTLIPRNTWLSRPFQTFEKEFESMFGRAFEPSEMAWLKEREGMLIPETNVAETEKTFEVTAEIPGMKAEEIKVEIKNHELWITGEKKEEKEEKGKTFHRVERRYGQFSRMVTLPSPVKEEEVKAEYKEGVLKVIVPKVEVTKAKTIEVKTV